MRFLEGQGTLKGTLVTIYSKIDASATREDVNTTYSMHPCLNTMHGDVDMATARSRSMQLSMY